MRIKAKTNFELYGDMVVNMYSTDQNPITYTQFINQSDTPSVYGC